MIARWRGLTLADTVAAAQRLERRLWIAAFVAVPLIMVF